MIQQQNANILYVHLKRLFIWIIFTIIFGLLLSFAFLFSRDLTLNTVKKNQFKIYYSFLSENFFLDEKTIQQKLDILLSNKNYPLLPLALISNDKCIENTNEYYAKRFDLSICKNINYINLVNLDKSKIYYDKDNLKIIEYNNKHYIIEKFDNKDTWLLANVKDYYKFNNYQNFFKFTTDLNKGLSWLSSTNSIKTFLFQSKFIWTVLLPFSGMLYILFTIYYLKQSQRNRKLIEEKNSYTNKWNDLNSSIKKLINEQTMLEKEVNEKSKLEIKNNLLQEEFNILLLKNKELISDIEIHKTKLKEIEIIEDTLSSRIKNTSKNLTESEKGKLLDESLNKLNQIDLLWKYNPTWQERYDIENIVSLREEFTPFTMSQAFMCFEKIIENFVVNADENQKNVTLVEQINFIFEKELLPKRFKDDLHLIRKARNKWFHNSEQPDKKIYNILLDILDKTKTPPLL